MHLDIAARAQAQLTLDHLCAMLAAGQLDAIPPFLSATACNGRFAVTLEIHRGPEQVTGETKPVSAETKPAKPVTLSALDRLILSKLKTTLQTRTRLANICDHSDDNHFRTRLRRLVELGQAVKETGQYRLP